ncbi:MAG: hypothetical protein KGQ52_13350 [Alphaproteobacteria bacterium]|nr:hypothetical protein [Alphaproteobacteria bacterium]
MSAPCDTNRVALPLAPLRRALQLLTTVAPRRATLPILSHVYLHVAGNLAAVTAYDFDQHLRITVPSDGPCANTAWGTCLPAAPLAALLARMDGATVLISTDEAGKATVQGAGIAATLPTMAEADFPVCYAVQAETPFVWPSAALADALALVAPAISKEKTRYYLNGISFAGGQHGEQAGPPQMVATDGHRAHLVDWPAGTPWPTGWPILPRAAVATLRKLLAAAGDQQWITADFVGARARFTIGAFELTSKLIDGTFPDYRRILPKPDAATLRLAAPGKAVIRALRQATSLCTKRTRAVRMIDGGNVWQAQCVSPENGVITVDVAGGTASASPDWADSLAFNAAYMAQAVAALGGSDIVVEAIGSGSSPALITNPARPTHRAVLMPMRF